MICGGALFAVLILLLCLKIDFLYQFVGRRLESFLRFVMLGDGGDASTTGRARLIDFGLNLFKVSPVYGHGIGTFKSLFSLTHGSWLTSADNNYVELLADVGIVGFLSYYVPLTIFLINNLPRITKSNIFIRFSVAGIVAFSCIDFATVWFFSKCGMFMLLIFYLITKFDFN